MYLNAPSLWGGTLMDALRRKFEEVKSVRSKRRHPPAGR
jgi:hypothetical protein